MPTRWRSPLTLAALLNNLSNRRSAVGDRAGALGAIEEAVVLRAELAGANPAAFTPDLAGSLVNLSSRRSEAGDRAGALIAIEDATSLYLGLAAVNPAAFTPDLATSLNNLSVQRSKAGNRAGALIAIEEAVAMRRELAGANPAAFTPDLAASLNNLSNRRSEAGDRAGALAAGEEAIAFYRELAGADPAAFTPDLAMSLNNLSGGRSETGDRAGGLSASKEATAFYRGLVEANPAAFTPDLAMSLHSLSVRRSETGDRAGALSAIEEAAAFYRDLAAAQPAAFVQALVNSSNLLADWLAEAGQGERATHEWGLSRAALAVPLFRAYLTAASAAWHDRRRDRAQAEERIRLAASEAHDPAGQQGAGGGARIPDFAVGESRQYVRSVALSMNPPADGLPQWATGTIPERDLALARAWSGAATWSATATVLREHACVVTGPTLGDTLAILVALHPGDHGLARLSAVREAILEHGLDQVLADLTAQDEMQTMINDWIGTDTWSSSFTYLSEHRERLSTDEVVQVLVAQQDPTASQHAAILILCQTTTLEQIAEWVTHASAAADLALDSIDAGDLGLLHLLTAANPGTLQIPGTGLLLQAVLLLAAGEPDRAAETARAAADMASEVQCRAHAIRLERLAKHADEVEGGSASVAALIDAYAPRTDSTLHGNDESQSGRSADPGHLGGPR